MRCPECDVELELSKDGTYLVCPKCGERFQ